MTIRSQRFASSGSWLTSKRVVWLDACSLNNNSSSSSVEKTQSDGGGAIGGDETNEMPDSASLCAGLEAMRERIRNLHDQYQTTTDKAELVKTTAAQAILEKAKRFFNL